MNTAPSKQRFRKHHRIRHAVDFRRVYARRRRVSDEWLLLYGDRNNLDHPRLGLSVSRRVGGAVVRNRWKRLLREAFRLNLSTLPAGLDIVVIPRPGRRPQLSELSRSLTKLAARLHKKLHSD